MKKQSRLSRLHESLGERHRGPHEQSMKSRTHESEAMKKPHHKHRGERSMEVHEHLKHAMHHLKKAHGHHKKHSK